MIKEILILLTSALTLNAFAAFKENSQRYISSYDFQNRMGYFFDEVYKLPGSNDLIRICFSNNTAFGANMAATGSPVNSAPNSATIAVIRSCATTSIQQLSSSMTAGSLSETESYAILSRIIPKSVLDKKTASIKLNSLFSKAAILDADELKETIRFIVQEFLGTEENISSYGLITDLGKYNDYLFSKVDKSMSLENIFSIIVSELVLRDEFLTY